MWWMRCKICISQLNHYISLIIEFWSCNFSISHHPDTSDDDVIYISKDKKQHSIFWLMLHRLSFRHLILVDRYAKANIDQQNRINQCNVVLSSSTNCYRVVGLTSVFQFIRRLIYVKILLWFQSAWIERPLVNYPATNDEIGKQLPPWSGGSKNW